MHQTTTRTARTTRRSPQPKLTPYFMDEVGFTLSDILRARAADTVAASVK